MALSDRVQTVRRRRPLSRRRKLVFSLFVLGAALGAAELGLRGWATYKANAERGRALPGAPERAAYQCADPYLGHALAPGYDAGGITVNALGFRSPEVAIPKPAGTFRIVAVGDSCTFGLGGDPLNPWPRKLELSLLARAGGDRARYEVVNAGVECYSTAYVERQLETRIAQLEPDLVVVYAGWNDIWVTSPFEVLDNPEWSPGQPLRSTPSDGLLERSYLVKFLRRLLLLELPRWHARWRDEAAETRECLPGYREGFDSRMRRIVESIRGMGARPVLVTLPTILGETNAEQVLELAHYPTYCSGRPRFLYEHTQRYNEGIRSLAREEGVPLFDAFARFDSLPSETRARLFFDTVHMLPEGCQVFAEQLGGFLSAQGLLRAP